MFIQPEILFPIPGGREIGYNFCEEFLDNHGCMVRLSSQKMIYRRGSTRSGRALVLR